MALNPAGVVRCETETRVPLPESVVAKTLCFWHFVTPWAIKNSSKSYGTDIVSSKFLSVCIFVLCFYHMFLVVCVQYSHWLKSAHWSVLTSPRGWGLLYSTFYFFFLLTEYPMERMCSLHTKDDWVQLNCPDLICVQSNQLKSSWPRWTHFIIKHTGELVDTAAQLSSTDAAKELCWFEHILVIIAIEVLLIPSWETKKILSSLGKIKMVWYVGFKQKLPRVICPNSRQNVWKHFRVGTLAVGISWYCQSDPRNNQQSLL